MILEGHHCDIHFAAVCKELTFHHLRVGTNAVSSPKKQHQMFASHIEIFAYEIQAEKLQTEIL